LVLWYGGTAIEHLIVAVLVLSNILFSHQQNQSRAEKRKAEAKARWEANLKRKQELAAKK
jgi:hypothetical protein